MGLSWSCRLAPALAAVALLLGVERVEAIQINSGDVLPHSVRADTGTGWKITFDDPRIMLVDWAENPTWDPSAESGANSIQGTLTIVEEFTSLLPIVFTFEDTDSARGDEFGLRVTLIKDVTNKTPDPWKAFNTFLEDKDLAVLSTGLEFASSAHPTTAHFHSPTILAQGNNGLTSATIESGPNPYKDEAFAALNRLVVHGGELGVGETQEFLVGMHDWRADGKARKFTMTQTPIKAPEPSVLLVLASGLVGMGAIGWATRRAVPRPPAATSQRAEAG